MSVQKKRSSTSANNSPWFKFWGSDFKSATVGWTLAEKGGYMELLIASWEADGLPADTERVFLIHGGIDKVWKCLESKFPIAADGRRRNPRQERIRIEMIETAERKSGQAKRAADRRWDVDSNADSNAGAYASASPNDMREQCGTHAMLDARCQMLDAEIPNPEKHTLNGVAVEPDCEKKKTAKSIPASEIERVWECFPRKVGKLKSLALIRKACDLVAIEHDLIDAGDAVEYMIEKVNLFADECRKKATEPQFIPHPQTWLNGGRYLDPVVTESH